MDLRGSTKGPIRVRSPPSVGVLDPLSPPPFLPRFVPRVPPFVPRFVLRDPPFVPRFVPRVPSKQYGRGNSEPRLSEFFSQSRTATKKSQLDADTGLPWCDEWGTRKGLPLRDQRDNPRRGLPISRDGCTRLR